jgi:hypothetical protein
MKEANTKTTGGIQSTLDDALEKRSDAKKVFTCEGVTHAIARLVACDDQVRTPRGTPGLGGLSADIDVV